MTGFRVLVCDDNVAPWLAQDTRLGQAGISLAEANVEDPDSWADVIGVAQAYVGVYFPIAMQHQIGDGFRLLQVSAAGVDQIDLAGLPDDVIVANSHGHGRSIAEHVAMVTLALRRRLLWRDDELRRGRWHSKLVAPRTPGFTTLRGATLGVVGLGHVGQAVAGLAGDLGMRTVAATRSPNRHPVTEGLAWVRGLDAVTNLCQESDIVVLACPLTPQTEQIIARPQLDALGTSGLLVNVGRGGLIDEGDLVDALREQRIAGAAIDVWSMPAGSPTIANHPLARFQSVIMTPHYSATAENTYAERAREIADNLIAVAAGRHPANALRVPVRQTKYGGIA